MAEEAAPRDGDTVLTREGLRETLQKIIQEEPGLLQINEFGVIPKPHQPGKWMLIVDLSHPPGTSVWIYNN